MIKNLSVKQLYVVLYTAVLTGCAVPMPEGGNAGMPVNVSYSSLMAEAQADTSIKLAYGTEPLQFGRLYLPAVITEGSKVPLLVFIHGGCWLNAYDLNHSTAFSQAVANAGIAVWSVEYRRVGDIGGGWPGSYSPLTGCRFFHRLI